MTRDEMIKKNLDIHSEWMKYIFENPDVLDRIPKGAVLSIAGSLAASPPSVTWRCPNPYP